MAIGHWKLYNERIIYSMSASEGMKPIKVTHKHLNLFKAEIVLPFALFIFVLALSFIFPGLAKEQENIDVGAVYSITTENDGYVTGMNTELKGGNILRNDIGKDLSVEYFDFESKNGGSVLVRTNGTFMYQPPMNFIGKDSFRYFVTDRFGNNAKGTVVVQVKSKN